jgi:tRNA threonylcarbamoyladenosine biosynthesis protein TsaE
MRGHATVEGEEAMVALGECLGRELAVPMVVFLRGELGAGKTTLARGILRALGYSGAVKSPTYTLVEPYELQGFTLYHFDLYRLGNSEELEYMGIRDYLDGDSIALVEWPERGGGILPRPDLIIDIAVACGARNLTFEACTTSGVECVKRLPIEPARE